MAKSVFYDIADTPEEAANLTARSLLMIAIEERIKQRGWTQTEAAEILHVNQPRVSDLMNGKLHKFSLDALVNMLPAVGLMFDVHPIESLRDTTTRPESAPAKVAPKKKHQGRPARPTGRSVKVAAVVQRPTARA
jgi:predicted XRE-type DNA-binding protein